MNLIDHAKILYTDSFHETVSSILFHTKFKIFARDGIQMRSRIENLLKKKGLDTVDSFERADENIALLRKESRKFLQQAFDEK